MKRRGGCTDEGRGGNSICYCSAGGWHTPREELNASQVHSYMTTHRAQHSSGEMGHEQCMNSAVRMGHS